MHPGLRLAVPAAAAAVLLTACGSGSGGGPSGNSGGAQHGVITWGLIAPFSGSAADYGPPEKAADVAAIQYVNSHGGIKVGSTTYKMALKTYDSAYDPTTAVTVTRQAVQQDGVKYLEITGGGIVPAVQPVTEPAKAMIFAIAGGDSYLGPKHPLTFRPYYDIPSSSSAILKEFKKISKIASPKVDIVATDDDLGHDIGPKQQTLATQDGYTAKVVYLPRSTSDYSPVATKVVADHPDIVDTSAAPGDQYAPFIKAMSQLGYKGVYSFPDTLDSTTVAKSVPLSSIAGSLTAPAWDTFTSPAGQFFKQSVTKQVGDVQPWTAQCFDNILLFKAAVEKAQSLDTSKIAAALSQVHVEGALGQVGYGGASSVGLPRIFIVPYPVDEIMPNGSLKTVAKAS